MNYIAIEGADGTGKTRLTKALVELLSQLNGSDKVLPLHEPYGNTEVTAGLRKFCLDKRFQDEVNWRAREYMLLASRAISTKFVQNYFTNHPDGTVITDRSIVSGMVYAHVASNMSFTEWAELAKRAFWVLPTVIVHVTVKKQNIAVTDGDIYDGESSEFHKKIRETFPRAIDYMFRNEKSDVKLIEFKNDFEVEPNQNAERLLKLLKE